MRLERFTGLHKTFEYTVDMASHPDLLTIEWNAVRGFFVKKAWVALR